MGIATLLVLPSWALFAIQAAVPGKTHAALAGAGTFRLIGYVDAAAHTEVPLESYVHPNLTHLVVTNAVKVDSTGAVHTHASQHPSVRSGEEVLRALAKTSAVKVIVGLRGQPDDVALDELAEVDAARERFASRAAALVKNLGASGLEIEWHSDDPAGGKPIAAPFDAMEQHHFALLCRDLANALHTAGGLTLSVAVRPGRQELADGAFARQFIDWLAIRAYSMHSLGDPHHSSFKDMTAAMDEWILKGVPSAQLVMATPLFGRPGDHNEALRASWREILRSGLRPQGGDMRGDAFIDTATGKRWWVSGLNTTSAKAKHILENGFGGVAFRDLHHDAQEKHLSLVEGAIGALQDTGHASSRRHFLASGLALIQHGLVQSRFEEHSSGDRHDEL